MAARLYDSFNRNSSSVTPVALGTSDSGHTYVDLSSPAGAVTLLSDAARIDPAAALGAVTLDAGVDGGDGDVQVDLRVGVGRPGAGLGAYFRCVDAANWWRAYQRVYAYQYQTGTETYVSGYTQVFSHYEKVLVGYTPTSYQWGQNYSYDGGGVFVSHGHTSYAWSTSNTSSPFASSYSHGHDGLIHTMIASGSAYLTGSRTGGEPIYEQRAVYTSQPIYSTRATYATTTGYDLRVERQVAGVLETRSARQVTGPLAVIRVVLRGDKIDTYAVPGSGSPAVLSVVDTTHQAATRHGFGRGKPTEFESWDNDLIDNFSFTPLLSGKIQPPVLL